MEMNPRRAAKEVPMFTPGESADLAHLQRMILDHLADAVIALDRQRRIVFWNPGAERLCRLSASKALGQRPSDVQLAPWFSAAEEAAIFSALKHAEIWRGEAIYFSGNGATEHVEQSITALCDPDGATIGFLVVMRNITCAKRKERVGEVISNKMTKTIVVRVERRYPHPKFKKVVTGYKKLYAHDEKSEAKVGDRVRIEETRPLSKIKRWRLVEVVEKSSGVVPVAV